MKIVGVCVAGGAPVFSITLPHGGDPYRLAWQHGQRIVRPLSVTGSAPELSLTVQVVAHRRSRVLPPATPRTIDPDLDLGTLTHAPESRQRVAAYGIVLGERGLLATQFSDQTAVPGLWGLPGGGVDPGEGPGRALTREVAEETGQILEISQLLDVQTDHWIGRAPSGIIEDFHAVRLIYAGVVTDASDAVVHDVGGTTAAADWVAVNRWSERGWSAWARVILERHLANLLAERGRNKP